VRKEISGKRVLRDVRASEEERTEKEKAVTAGTGEVANSLEKVTGWGGREKEGGGTRRPREQWSLLGRKQVIPPAITLQGGIILQKSGEKREEREIASRYDLGNLRKKWQQLLRGQRTATKDSEKEKPMGGAPSQLPY